MKKYILLLIVILLYGCTTNTSTSTPATEVITEIETTTEMSIGQTIESEIATVPDFSLSTPPGNHCRRYTDETTMDYLDYYLFVPEDAVKDMPLVIFLHGDGEAFISQSAAVVIADSGIVLIGTDGISLSTDFDEMRVHLEFARKGVAVLEGLDLKGIRDGDYTLCAFPIKLSGAEAAPCRAILLEQEKGI